MRHGPSLVRRPSLSPRISQFPSTFAFEASSPKQHKNPSSFFSSPPTASDRGFLRSEAGIVFCIVAPRFFISLIAQRVVLQLYLVLHCHTFPPSGLPTHSQTSQSEVVLVFALHDIFLFASVLNNPPVSAYFHFNTTVPVLSGL
jgi:hypothetical protein